MERRNEYRIVPGYAEQEREALLVLSRRDFMRNGLIAVITVISAGVAIPVVRYFIDPALKEPQTEWVGIATAADIPVGTPTRVEYLHRTRDGWRAVTGRYAAWVVTKDGQEFVAFGPKCTHLGCAYRWDGKEQQFLCPCHTGIFDIDGNVVSGPPPRPLDRYELRVREGQIEIGRLLKG